MVLVFVLIGIEREWDMGGEGWKWVGGWVGEKDADPVHCSLMYVVSMCEYAEGVQSLLHQIRARKAFIIEQRLYK